MEDKIKDILASNKFNDLYDNFIELQRIVMFHLIYLQ